MTRKETKSGSSAAFRGARAVAVATSNTIDMSQRMIQAGPASGGDFGEHSYQIGRAPPAPEAAPPGCYMRFALGDKRVRSVVEIVRPRM